MTILLITCFNFIVDYSTKLLKIYFNNSLSSKLIFNKTMKKRKKSYNNNASKLNISKYSKNKIKENNNNENEKSSNYLMSSTSNIKLNIISSNKKNYLNLNYIPKITRFHEGASYKNDFYSSQILKNISNKSMNSFRSNNIMNSKNK